MLTCKILGKNAIELELSIDHFGERFSQNEEGVGARLSCIFTINGENVTEFMPSLEPFMPEKIVEAVEFYEDGNLIAKYSNYNSIASIQIDYNIESFNCVILFGNR